MKRKLLSLLLGVIMIFTLVGCSKPPSYSDFPIGDGVVDGLFTVKITFNSDIAPRLYVGDEYQLDYKISDVLAKPTATVYAKGSESVGIWNKDANIFFAKGLGSFTLRIVCDQEVDYFKEVNISVVERPVAGGSIEPSKSFNFTTDNEEALADSSEETALWQNFSGKYGNEGKVNLAWYSDDIGLYFKATVKDENLYSAKRGLKGSSAVEDADRVEFHLDLGADGGKSPQIGDFRIRVDLMGNYDVAEGTGSSWKFSSVYKPDTLVAGLIGGTKKSTIMQRSASATSVTPMLSPEGGYKIKMFLSYQNFGFSQKDRYNLSVGHADFMSVDGAQVFVGVGDVSNPDKFLPLTSYGYGTSKALEAVIDGKSDDAIYTSDAAKTYHITEINYGGNASRGKVDCKTTVVMGKTGLYMVINTTQPYLQYEYAAHTWKAEHLEMRIDTNGDRVSQNTQTGDLYLHQDLLGSVATAYGITDDTRSVGVYDYMSYVDFSGEVMNYRGVPTINKGSTDPKCINMEIYIPYSSMSVKAGDNIRLFAALGNYWEESKCNVGFLFNLDGTTEADRASYNMYEKYIDFTVPQDADVSR